MKSFLSTLTVALLLITATHIQAAPAPESPGKMGQRAFDDLALLYSDNPQQPDVASALRDVNGQDPADRKSAGEYFLALLKQSFADESNGRAKWKQTPFFGGGSESAAREFRIRIAEQFGKTARTKEALPAALWLIEDEKLAKNQTAGVQVIVRIPGDEMIPVYRKLLSPLTHNPEVAVAVIEEVAVRKIKPLADVIQPLCNNYRATVRQAARTAAPVLGLPNPGEFQPQNAFTPWLDGELKDIAAMVLTPIPADTKWKRFTVTRDLANNQVFEFSGWLLSEDETSYHVLNLFAAELTLAKSETKIADRTFKQDVDYYLDVRKGDRRNQMDVLSERGGLTGQFQAPFVSLPEALLSAWCYARGDKASAATVLFPRIDDTRDERYIKMVIRDLLGWHYYDQLLQAFCSARDYPAALRIAQHLAKPIFDDYQYQDRAKALVRQLPRRADDFKNLTLPTAAQWQDLSKTLSRSQQIEYFAKRLRLLNCFQHRQPGGVDFEDTQSDRPIRFSEPGTV